jgi:hypothetical protein
MRIFHPPTCCPKLKFSNETVKLWISNPHYFSSDMNPLMLDMSNGEVQGQETLDLLEFNVILNFKCRHFETFIQKHVAFKHAKIRLNH